MTGQVREAPSPTREAAPAVARLAEISVSAPLTTVAWRVAEVAAEAFPGLGAAVTVLGPGKALGLEFSGGGLAATLDERQFAPGYGPALEAARLGRPVVVDETSDGTHADYRRLAARHGVRQVRAWPLVTETRVATIAGSLTLYGAEITTTTGPERAQFDTFRAAAALLIGDAVHLAGAVQTAQQLQEAMRSRAVIEQAKGIIMAHSRCTSDEAFARLKSLSSMTNQKVRLVALSIVENAGS